MTHDPSDDNIPPAPPAYDEQETMEQGTEEEMAQETAPYAQEAFQSQEPRKESSGFGFVAMVAGLISLAALAVIVVYSLLLAPSPPKQPILIEAEGTTKQTPADSQVRPEPNSDVGVFRMLRGTEEEEEPSEETETALIVKPGAPAKKGEEKSEEAGETSSAIAKPGATPDKEEETGEGEEAEGVVTESDTTASLERQEEKTGAAAGEWYVQIAALESRSAADEAWARLHDQLPELLYTQSYVAREAKLASGKRVWRLLLGPQGRGQAETLCRELKARERGCLVKKIKP